VASKSLERLLVSLVVALLAGCFARQPPKQPPTQSPTQPALPEPRVCVETHFSPEEQIAPTIVKLIDGAKRTLDIAAFAYTHPDIAAATIRAHERGVRVQMIMDTTNASARDSLVPDLLNAGIEVRVRHKRGDQHSKYLVIDQSIVVTGSFNFTIRADERNSENLLVIRNSPEVVKAFLDDYQTLRADSVAKNR